MQSREVRLVFAVLWVFWPAVSKASFLEKSNTMSAVLGRDASEMIKAEERVFANWAEQARHETQEVSNQSNLDLPKMPVVNHAKTPSNGYLPGSPLYNESQVYDQGGNVHVYTPAAPAYTPAAPASGILRYSLFTIHREGMWVIWKISAIIGTYFFIVVMIQVLFWACIYVHIIGRAAPQYYPNVQQTPHEFSFGLCDTQQCCESHKLICFCSFCFPFIRWADTMAKQPLPHFMNFWAALLLIVAIEFLPFWIPLFGVLLMLAVLVHYRQKLRQQYGIRNNTCATVAEDCLIWGCCCCCALAQEARQVEFVLAGKSEPLRTEPLKTTAPAKWSPKPSSSPAQSVTVGYDTTRDGRADLYVTGVDASHDGIPDVLERPPPTAVYGTAPRVLSPGGGLGTYSTGMSPPGSQRFNVNAH